MTVINSNTLAMRAANASLRAGVDMSRAAARLSTGMRINSASDDAAGLAISTSMTAQIRGIQQGIKNANDGISLVQTAQGALAEITNMAQRIRELAVQSTSETYQNIDRANMQKEVAALSVQMQYLLVNTKFNGQSVFFDNGNGGSASFSIQTGPDSGDILPLSFGLSGLSFSTGTGLPSSPSPLAYMTDRLSTVLNSSALSYSTVSNQYAMNFFAPGPGYFVNGKTYIVTSIGYNINDNIASGIQAEFGANATMADWNQVQSDLGSAQLASEFLASVGLPVDTQYGYPNIDVKKGGSEFDGARGRWFITNFTGSSPASLGYAAFGNIYNQAYLGSFNLANQALVVVPGQLPGAKAASSASSGTSPASYAAVFNVTTTADAQSTISSVDNVLGIISSANSIMGVAQSVLESNINKSLSEYANLSESISRISDTDYSYESISLLKSKIIMDASSAMLVQANQNQKNVLNLIGVL